MVLIINAPNFVQSLTLKSTEFCQIYATLRTLNIVLQTTDITVLWFVIGDTAQHMLHFNDLESE